MKLSPDQRGLGYDHRRRRGYLRKPEGDPCPYCARPMWPEMALDLDHVVLRAQGGADGPVRWAHARCNRREGGRVAAKFRREGFRAKRSRRW